MIWQRAIIIRPHPLLPPKGAVVLVSERDRTNWFVYLPKSRGIISMTAAEMYKHLLLGKELTYSQSEAVNRALEKTALRFWRGTRLPW